MPVLEDFFRLLKERTGVRGKDQWLLDEINESLDWLWPRVYSTNPNLNLTFGATGTFAANTQTFDLAASVNANIYGLKAFWVKRYSSDKYFQVRFIDSGRPEFVARDQLDAQLTDPVYVDTMNFNQLRFAPTVLAGSYWRADWIGRPNRFSLSSQVTIDVPDEFSNPITDYATALVFDGISDDRAVRWFQSAEIGARRAIQAVKRRQFQNKPRIQSWPPHGRSL